MRNDISKLTPLEVDVDDLYRKYEELRKRLDEAELRIYALERVILRLIVEVRKGGAYGEVEHSEDTD